MVSHSTHILLSTFTKFILGPGHIGARKEKGAGDGDTSFDPIKSKEASKKDIWAANEVLSKEEKQATIPIPNDPRKTPKYTMHYRQAVTTEDVFLQVHSFNIYIFDRSPPA